MATTRSLQVAAQAWCDSRTAHLVMQPALAEVFAEILDKYKEAQDKRIMNDNKYHAVIFAKCVIDEKTASQFYSSVRQAMEELEQAATMYGRGQVVVAEEDTLPIFAE